MRRRSLAVRGAALLLGVTTTACSSAPQPVAGETAAAVAVSVATVSMADLTDAFEAGGVVEARTTATLTARILAPVLDIRVAPGDRVRAGQLLLVLDSRELGAESRRARARTEAGGRE